MKSGQAMIEKIERTIDFEDEKTLLLFNDLGDIKGQGLVTKEQGIKILKWKSPRPLDHYELNSNSDFKDISKLAFDSSDERIRMHAPLIFLAASFR